MLFPQQGYQGGFGGGGGAAGGGGGGGVSRRRPSGPIQGLQSPTVQTMVGGGSGGGGGAARTNTQQATFAAQQNQNVQNRFQPFLNAQGGVSRPVGLPPTPVGYDQNGRGYYGWGPDGPVYNPQIDYVQTGPADGGRGVVGPTQQQTQPTGPMGGLIGAMPTLPPVAPIGPIEDAEAVREAYARAKDVAGKQGRAAMDSLMDVQGARGIVGSGLGVNEAGDVISEGARQLGDFNREQAIQRVENERWRQGTNYQGGISQRGQDLGWQNMELQRRRWNAENSPRGHVQGEGVNPIPGWPRY